MIRRAVSADASALLPIWNRLITDTTVTFNPTPKTEDEVAAFIATTPVFVADVGSVQGYASYGPFRHGAGYARTAEHSIVLAEHAWGQGVGRLLLNTVADHAKDHDIHSLIAGISAENEDGIGFHKAMGFVQVGLVPQAGHKFGRYIDLVLMQKHL